MRNLLPATMDEVKELLDIAMANDVKVNFHDRPKSNSGSLCVTYSIDITNDMPLAEIAHHARTQLLRNKVDIHKPNFDELRAYVDSSFKI